LLRPSTLLKDRAGYSLVELMVALVLTGIMLASAVPALSRYLRTHELLGYVENFSADLRLCRQRAATQGNNFVFTWDAGAETYTILDDTNSNGVADAGEPTIGPKDMPVGLTLTNGPDNAFVSTTLTFTPNGAASENGQVTIADANGLSRVVRVLRSTGLVKVL
jgi:prepilin-type N-terminal cleavage/methylation domain-containing protein